MNRLWQDAAAMLETATAAGQSDPSELAILVDARNTIRIVDGGGWQFDALRREYQASTAYFVQRNAAGVKVTAKQGQDCCSFEKKTTGDPLAILSGAVPRHLLAPPPTAACSAGSVSAVLSA